MLLYHIPGASLSFGRHLSCGRGRRVVRCRAGFVGVAKASDDVATPRALRASSRKCRAKLI